MSIQLQYNRLHLVSIAMIGCGKGNRCYIYKLGEVLKMKKRISIIVAMIVLMTMSVTSLFADEKPVVGVNPVQDSVKTADSERAAKRLDSHISAALLKIKKLTVAKREGKEDVKDVNYLLDLNITEYAEETATVKKMVQRNARYAVEVKFVNVVNNHILIQETINGSFQGEKVPMTGVVPEVVSAVMEALATKIADKVTGELFPVSVLKVSEGGIITIANYGFNIGEVFNVYTSGETFVDADGVEVKDEVKVCPIIVLEISGSTARCLIHTLKPYKSQYKTAVVEVGMRCRRADDAPIDEKTLAPLFKQLKKLK